MDCILWSPMSIGLNILTPEPSPQETDFALASPTTTNVNQKSVSDQDLERNHERELENERERQDAITRDLDAQLRMWTEAQFPDLSNKSFFPVERDTASRSRHKAINPSLSAPAAAAAHLPNPHSLALGTIGGVSGIGIGNHFTHGLNDLNFFGNVGADLLSAVSSNGHGASSTDAGKDLDQDSPAAAHERAKLQQMQGLHHLYHQHHIQTTPSHSIQDLFSWGFNPSSVDALFSDDPVSATTTGDRPSGGADPTLDPFLALRSHPTSTPHTMPLLPHNFGLQSLTPTSDPRLSGPSTTGDGLLPLTVRGSGSREAVLLAQAQAQALSIDPAATSLTHRPHQRSAASLSIDVEHPSKRQRISKSLGIAGDHGLGSQVGDDEDEEMMDEATSPNDKSGKVSTHPDGTPLTAAEDKRRRNTLASARFRLKKKEREAAMEHKAKELDDKVSSLERECESLRKENKWLKSLVVGTAMADEDSIGTIAFGAASSAVMASSLPLKEKKGSSDSSPSIPALQSAAKGGVIDLDELVRVLKANGAIIAGSAAGSDGSSTPAKTKVGGPSTTTGKRKRNGGSH
ncbi:hypothetical protein FRC19_011969 [Serendipita sp. 401]|nr:hypothetical protein FRC19_011969 [Serendipita sp. 401]